MPLLKAFSTLTVKGLILGLISSRLQIIFHISSTPAHTFLYARAAKEGALKSPWVLLKSSIDVRDTMVPYNTPGVWSRWKLCGLTFAPLTSISENHDGNQGPRLIYLPFTQRQPIHMGIWPNRSLQRPGLAYMCSTWHTSNMWFVPVLNMSSVLV